jgi:hypothetical protein
VASLRNTPQQPALLVLAARKSFSFTVQFVDSNDRPLQLVDATASFTIGEQAYSNTPILTQQADTVLSDTAVALFNLQASQLDLVPGTYPFEIVLTTEGYSSIAINGELEVEESYEVGSLSQSYDVAPSTYGLVAHLKHNRLVVTSNALVLKGAKGDKGDTGKSGMPWASVAVTYNDDDRIETLTIDDVTTTYVYNGDGTIASDERDGITRDYTYDDGKVVSIEPIGP